MSVSPQNPTASSLRRSAPDPEASGLLTDLYQLTMLQAYFDRGMNGLASFELFCRELPAQRNFLVAAGLDTALDWLEGLRVAPQEVELLAGLGRFSPGFLRSLEGLRFTGEVWAMPEGTPFLPQEPMLRVTAPLREAQLIESRLVNLLHFQTVVASKAVRCVSAAQGRQLVDFGMRRAHGAEAALLSARASWLAGFDATATVLAGVRFGIPVMGTMAHSFVQAHEREQDAFEHFARSQPNHASLLIDTWDTPEGARRVVELAHRLAPEGIRIRSVRIDSGDLSDMARQVRRILDDGGLAQTTIFASGNLDEDRIDALLHAGAPIDGFGVGTRMNTSADAPYLDCAYKLVAYEGRPTAKRSPGKATLPGTKQVWRRYDLHGRIEADRVELDHQPGTDEPLLRPVMRGGERLPGAAVGLAQARTLCRQCVAALPAALQALGPAAAVAVELGPALVALTQRLNLQRH